MDDISATDLDRRLELARSAAREAGQLTLGYFQTEIQVERKSDNSPVTIADKRAEQLLRDRIAASFADDGIIGEEFPEASGSSGFRWILDPIDGTKSFISGVPLYATLVGVEWRQRSVIGVIYAPGLDECVFAARGRGTWYESHGSEPRRVHVSVCSRLSDGLMVTSEIGGFSDRNAREAFDQLESSAWITRTWGDGYGYLLVATGRAEVMIDPVMNLWDAAAIQPVLEEAGGTFTDWQGEPGIRGGEGIGTNGRVLQEVLSVTKQFPRPQ